MMKTYNIPIHAASVFVICLVFSLSTITCMVLEDDYDFTSSQSRACEDNENCKRDEFCVEGKCRDVCDPNYTAIDELAECYSLGDHNALWSCPMKYPGDPFVSCELNCTVDNDCPINTRCVSKECRYSCDKELYTVAEDAECIEDGDHGVKWKCPDGFNGNPYIDCGDECNDEFCPDDELCVDNKCTYACDAYLLEGNLVEGSTCYAKNHTAYWSCPKNFHGDPFVSCDDNCSNDNDCLDSEKCLNKKCVSACSHHFFKDTPTFGMCSAQNHTGQLFDCINDKSPVAVKYCERRYLKCLNDNDCILTAVCDNGYCLSACFDFTCKENEYCETKMHEPRCEPLTSHISKAEI